MKIYLFFKKYYIAFWNKAALFLWKKWITPNQASIFSLFIILPLFISIHYYVEDNTTFWILIFIAINIKLILNAIDGIIAREKNITTKLWSYLNVWTDIWPDMLIIYVILSYIWASSDITILILSIVFVYLIFEYIVIHFYNKQNLFLCIFLYLHHYSAQCLILSFKIHRLIYYWFFY